jgi:hypothetical protein
MLYVSAACPFCKPMSMQHVLAASPCCMSMLNVLAECPCFMSASCCHMAMLCPCPMATLPTHAACPCYISMCMSLLHAHRTYSCCISHTACSGGMSWLHVQGACQGCMSKLQVNTASLVACPCSMSVLHAFSMLNVMSLLNVHSACF